MDANHVKTNLTVMLEKFKTAMELQGIRTFINTFEGDFEKFPKWVSEIQKYSEICRLEDRNIKLVAFQTSTGMTSEYIRRRLINPAYRDESWADLKSNLTAKFAFVTDPHVAFLLLRQARQGEDESIVVFSERLIELADSSFIGQTEDSGYIEKQLIDIFIDGINKDDIRYQLMRANPSTLNDAITMAIGEESLRKRFAMRTGYQPGYWHD